jgi:Tfp pilus assembly protein FimT
MKDHEVREARLRAVNYGWPGQVVNSPNAKTGCFTGYWPSGRIAWKGGFRSGQQEGLWTYISKDGQTEKMHFYCNL